MKKIKCPRCKEMVEPKPYVDNMYTGWICEKCGFLHIITKKIPQLSIDHR